VLDTTVDLGITDVQAWQEP